MVRDNMRSGPRGILLRVLLLFLSNSDSVTMKLIPSLAWHLLLSLCFPLIAIAQSDAGYTWVHPRPTGDVLWDVAWVSTSTFVAVSENGFLYRTSDAGQSWSAFSAETFGPLWAIAHHDGLTVATGEGGRTFKSTDGGVSWSLDRIAGLDQVLRDLHISDRNHIVAVGSNLVNEGKVLVSDDGGNSWEIIDPGIDIAFRSIDFIDSLYGWATGTYGYLLATTDGGRSWTYSPSDTLYGTALNTIRFRSRDTGVVAGDYGRLFVTHDGGVTWMAFPHRNGTVFRDAVWVDDTTVVVTGELQQVRSTDAGLTWSEMHVGWKLFGLGFGPDGGEGMTVGRSGEMQYTSDGGESWTNRWSGASGMNIYDIAVHDNGGIVAVGYGGGVLYSRDSGNSWNRRSVRLETISERLTDVAYPDVDHVVAFSRGGTVAHSSDGGESWIERVEGLPRYIHDISFADERTGWIVGDRLILKTSDGGMHWTVDSTSVEHRLWAVDAVSPSLAYATGDGGALFVTTDGGTLWEEVENEFTVQFSMVTADEGGHVTLGWLGGLVHSTDNGVTWVDNRAPDGSNIQHFSFLSPEVGWCGQHNAPLLSTMDAGASWQAFEHGLRVSSVGNAAMQVVELISPGVGYVGGAAGYILEFRDPDAAHVEERPDRRIEAIRLMVSPQANLLHVSGAESAEQPFGIFDLLGRPVLEYAIRGSQGTVNIASLPVGAYFVRTASGATAAFVKSW